MCGQNSFVNWGERKIRASEASCRSWNCETAAPLRKAQLIAQMVSGIPKRKYGGAKLLTLTVDPKRGNGPVDRSSSQMHAFQVLTKRMRRKYRNREIEFSWVREATQAGEPHLHVLLRSPFIPQRWLSEVMDELVGAKIVDIRTVWNPRQIARYLGKYLGKQPHRFGTQKRYSSSRNWDLSNYEGRAPNDKPVMDETVWSDVWELHGSPLAVLFNRWQSWGWRPYYENRMLYGSERDPPGGVAP